MKSGTDIEYAARLLRRGEVVAIPTETVYGLAANAFNADAVVKIYEVKTRPRFNPLIVHVNSWSMVYRLCLNIPIELNKIAEKFWPGPVTIIIPKNHLIPDIVTAGGAGVAVRMPAHPLALDLLSSLDFPLAAPSANPSGYISPTTSQDVIIQLGDKIKYVLDGGECSIGIESTIINMNDQNEVEILRHGGIAPEQIAKVLGYCPVFQSGKKNIEAPGMHTSHYAPKTPMVTGNLEKLMLRFPHKKIALLTFNSRINHPAIIFQKCLSSRGNLREAAKNLFRAMHELDACGAEIIIAQHVPYAGIGFAINDRLMRASSQNILLA